MKNLKLLELTHKYVGEICDSEIFAQNGDTSYFINKISLYKHDFKHDTTTELCPLFFKGVIHLQVLTIENKICMVTQKNIHILDSSGNNEILTLSFDNIAAISWNPTEEIVAIVSENGDVSTYSIDYENGEVFPQGQSSIWDKIPDTVYVGWGSKETQFRGSEGKIKNQSIVVDAKPVEDKKPTISWRGNGEMFVVNYWTDHQRKFVVFETPCKALYRSEECPGLQPPVAWRPAGNMIATLTETDKQRIVIFEKNGQKRFSFDLNFDNVRIKQLKWSPCAYILTLLSEDLKTGLQSIHLLTSSNYKWYEKQTLVFKSDNPLLDFDWSETTQFTYTLKVITKFRIIKYCFSSAVDDCSALCGVVDGKNLQLTDFTDSVIPPILFSKKITNSAPINSLAFNNKQVAIIDAKNCLKIFAVDLESVITSVNLGREVNDLGRFPLTCHHFTFTGLKIYFAADTHGKTVIYEIDAKSGNINYITATTEPVRHLLTTHDSIDIDGLKLIDSTLYMNDNSDSIRQDVKIIDNKVYNCHLTLKSHFYINDRKISDCVNSFIIFDDYLLFTTKLNELYCLRFDEESIKNDLSQNYRRNIEQGATIVTAIPNSPRIVLQLPRGNLETISCRLISIDILDRLLNDQKWEEAIRFIRLEKLNANLLYDLDSKRFLTQIDKFMGAVKTVNELNTICLEFERDNVLRTIYKNWGKYDDHPDKIDEIFSEIFEYFEKVDYADYITTIMAVKLTFYSLHDALRYLQDLLRRSYDDVSLKQKLTEAVNTLKTYGCDQEKLYKEALLLYDLDLAHFVASCCQLDPRVYEPQLNRLRDLPDNERRYEINLFAKQPEAALYYLLSMRSDPQTVMDLIKNHNLGREAYEFCACVQVHPHRQIITRAYAQDLSKSGCHREAGIVLKSVGLLEEALEEFKLGLQWRQVLNLTQELKFDHDERLKVVLQLAARLTNSHGVKDAAILYEYYADDYEKAIKVLVDHYYYEEAIHIIKKHNREDIMQRDVEPRLHYQYKMELQEKLADLYGAFKRYRERLAKVRRAKVDKLTNVNDDDDRDDLFSDAGSTITKSSRSSRSRSSTASSRNRRKEEKKKQDLREGGMYEDIALIRALHCTIAEIYRKGEEAMSWCVLVLQECIAPYTEVRAFHDQYWKIVDDVKTSMGQIWPPHFYATSRTENVQEVADLENLEHLDAEYRAPPKELGVKKMTIL